MSQTLVAVDHFAGAGGTSTGLALACKEKGRRVELTAINHWPKALETHRENHPWARHLLTSLEATDPLEVIPGGELDILVGSPECRFFSIAAGGRPKLDQGRTGAWQMVRWMKALTIDSVLVENVPEFVKWGPLDREGYPVKEKRGTTYRSWLHEMMDIGYNVDARVLNAADYGAHTSRRRLFVQARLGNRPISWPKPTHSRTEEGGLHKWLAAREVIDWSLKGQSIFTRKRPLSPNTIRRIIAGLKRFGGEELQPFLVLMEHSRNGDGSVRIDSHVKSVDDLVPTAKGGTMAVVEPFILSQGTNGAPKSAGEPVPSIMTAGKHALIEPFILSQASGGAPRPVSDSVPTIPAKGAHALVEGVIISYHGGKDAEKRSSSVEDPLLTQDTQNRFAIVVPNFGEREGQEPRAHSVSSPLPSPTSHGAGCLVETEFILPVQGFYRQNTPKSLDEPVGSITQRGYGSLVKAYIVKYYGKSDAQSVEEPLHTVKTRESFALVQPEINGKVLDILFRMLRPHELAGAMDFPKSYVFKGNQSEVVKQIGNAVAVRQAVALVRGLI